MIYKHFRPIFELAPFIDSIWTISATAESALTRKACMPADRRATLLVNFTGVSRMLASGGETHYIDTGATLLGAHSQSYILEHDGDSDLISVQFRPGGLAPFIGSDAGELTGQAIPLNLLWGSASSSMCEQIYEANGAVEKVALYQKALIGHFAEVQYQSLILQSLEEIDFTQRHISVEQLAAQANLSQKQFERVFERVVGIMPKRYIRLARFQKLVSWLNRHAAVVNWAKLAARFGYYDHSHMAKDFQAFAGTTPGDFKIATSGIVEVAYGKEGEPQEV